MSSLERFDILGLGCVAVDDLLTVAAYPPADAKVPVLGRRRATGGTTANALVAAARLGARCAFAGALGADPDSQFVLETFHREGIDTRHGVFRRGVRPIRTVVIADQSRQTRTIFYDLEGAQGADTSRPAADVIVSSRVLFVDHFGVEGMTRAARIAREAGVPIVADFECDRGPGFSELLHLVDHVILSRAFAACLTGRSEPATAIDRLWTSSRQVVAITDGASGCWYRSAETGQAVRHQPAFSVAVVDTTGCGDVFHGAYAATLAWGWAVQDRMRFAAAAAALKASRGGGPEGCPRRAEVEALAAEQPAGHPAGACGSKKS